MALNLESLVFPLVTNAVVFLLVYIIFVCKKILEEANQVNNAFPNIERLRHSLPLTLSSSWKLGDVVNGVPTWENHTMSSDPEHSIIACQALVQASAEAVLQDLSQPRMLPLFHPWISEANLIPVIHKQSKESEIKSDVVSVELLVSKFQQIKDLYLYWKNGCVMKRRWQLSKDSVSWIVAIPETRIYEHLLGGWQCAIAVDIVNEGKEASPSMCLLSIFTLTKSSDKATSATVKNGMATQIVNIREYIDSLYLKSMLSKDLNRSKRRSTATRPVEQRPKSLAGSMVSDSPNLTRSGSPTKIFVGQEERGYVETPAEIRKIDINNEKDENNVEEVESTEMAEINEKIAPYKETLDEAFKLLLETHDADEATPGWSYLGNRNDVEIYRMQGDDTCASACFKGTVEVNVPLTYALQYVTDLDFKIEWDDLFQGGKIIEELDLVTKIAYMEYKPVWPTTARDFCSITATRHVKGDTYAMAVKAATHPSCPPVKGRQRAEVITGGFIIVGVTDDPPVCKVTFVTRADLKGKIPASMVNKVNEKQPLYAGIIRDKMEERYMFQDPPHEGDVKINAAKKHPSLREKRETKPKPNGSIVNTVTKLEQKNDMEHQKAETLGKEYSDSSSGDSLFRTSSANNIKPVPTDNRLRELSNEEKDALFRTDKDWDTMSESSISSVDQTAEFRDPIGELNGYVKPLAEQNLNLPRDPVGNVDFKTLGNQAAANLLEEVLLASKVDIQKKVTEDANVPGTWSFQGIFKNVVVLRKIHKDCNIHSFLGRGVMNVLPVTIWESIKNPSSRFVYDNMLKKTKVAKEISDGLRVVHMRHETNACFVKQARDFVILTRERVDPDKYILSGTSVEIPECPVEKNCVRGNMFKLTNKKTIYYVYNAVDKLKSFTFV
eukprot:Seg4388.2 transcript_id=Seg4388.2/GoldUCD/mRNA.D3Y31 product="Protein ENHANCED DISEASE RESISTANCE 2-like" protein_id=Seg4388.2/GoldUCD/D3Y31